MNTALYAGSFDPPHYGHLDVIANRLEDRARDNILNEIAVLEIRLDNKI